MSEKKSELMLANEHASVALASVVYDPGEDDLLVAAFAVATSTELLVARAGDDLAADARRRAAIPDDQVRIAYNTVRDRLHVGTVDQVDRLRASESSIGRQALARRPA
jgi:hypothetical protein